MRRVSLTFGISLIVEGDARAKIKKRVRFFVSLARSDEEGLGLIREKLCAYVDSLVDGKAATLSLTALQFRTRPAQINAVPMLHHQGST